MRSLNILNGLRKPTREGNLQLTKLYRGVYYPKTSKTNHKVLTQEFIQIFEIKQIQKLIMTHSDFLNSENIEKFCRDIIEFLLAHPDYSRDKITNLKGRIGKKYHFRKVIKNAKILEYATTDELMIITPLLRRRKTRTLSGVSVIAIMTKPLSCPGECIYCPGQNSQPNEKVAKSYTGREPAAMRSIHNDYDPFLQVRSRIEDLRAIGHKVDKIELIVMGGTFLSADLDYQYEFMKGALEGVINKRVETLEEAKLIAETSNRRVIGITIETRPDYCTEKQVDRMLEFGTTRVEIGVQTVYDDIYQLVNRGHTTKDSIRAIRIAKDAGLKVNLHMMPNLPGSDISKDLEMFDLLFQDPNYRPDMLKIYPCLVIDGTEIYDWWKQGDYQPYNDEELIDLIASAKAKFPPYVRIQRIMRDIPAYLIEAGTKYSNLRQLVQNRLKENRQNCDCIRCREIGIVKRKEPIEKDSLDNVELCRIDYDASNGEEIFLSYENKKEGYLVGYLRLRKPSEKAHRSELNDGDTMIVREIKVVGEIVPTEAQPDNIKQIQHRGFGTKLLKEAESIAREEFNAKKLAVISGIGVRDWFYEMGYELEGPYVSKKLN